MHIKNIFLLSMLIAQSFTPIEGSGGPVPPAYYYSVSTASSILSMVTALHSFYYSWKEKPLALKQMQAQLLAQKMDSAWKESDRKITKQHAQDQLKHTQVQVKLAEVQLDFAKEQTLVQLEQAQAQLEYTQTQVKLTEAQRLEQVQTIKWKREDRPINQKHIKAQLEHDEAQVKLDTIQFEHTQAQLEHTQAQVKLAPIQFKLAQAQIEHKESEHSEQKISLQRTIAQLMLELQKIEKETGEEPADNLDSEKVIQQILHAGYNAAEKVIPERLKKLLKDQKKSGSLDTKKPPSYSVQSIKSTDKTEESN